MGVMIQNSGTLYGPLSFAGRSCSRHTVKKLVANDNNEETQDYNSESHRPAIDKFIMERVARHSLHDIALGLLIRQRDCRDEISAEVDAQDGDGAEWQRYVGENEDKER